MNILGIDPGYTESAYVLYDVVAGRPIQFGKHANEILLIDMETRILGWSYLVIEQVAAMGMAVGAEVFETVFWSGRFCERCEVIGRTWSRVKRHQVKTHLCGNQRAKDPHIRQALLDRYGPGKEIAIGKKHSPGPLYGISGDVWSALAVAVVWADTCCSDMDKTRQLTNV